MSNHYEVTAEKTNPGTWSDIQTPKHVTTRDRAHRKQRDNVKTYLDVHAGFQSGKLFFRTKPSRHNACIVYHTCRRGPIKIARVARRRHVRIRNGVISADQDLLYTTGWF